MVLCALYLPGTSTCDRIKSVLFLVCLAILQLVAWFLEQFVWYAELWLRATEMESGRRPSMYASVKLIPMSPSGLQSCLICACSPSSSTSCCVPVRHVNESYPLHMRFSSLLCFCVSCLQMAWQLCTSCMAKSKNDFACWCCQQQ